MAAPAAPVVVEAAPVAALLGASMIVVCAWITLVGLSKAYDYTLGALLHTLATALDFKVWRFNVRLGGAFDAVDHRMRDAIAAGIQGLEYTLGRFWHGLAWIARENADAVAAFANDVADAFDGLVNGEIPQQIVTHTRTIVKSVAANAHAADVRIRQGEAIIYRGIDQLRRDLTHEAQTAVRGIDDLRRLVTGVVMPDVRALDHTVDDVVGFTRKNLARRLTRVEQMVLGGAIVGAALATLTRYFPYWQCANVRGFNRALCRAPVGLPTELFAFLLAAGSIAGFRELVRLAQGATGETTEALHALLRVEA